MTTTALETVDRARADVSRFETATAEDILNYALERWGRRVALGTSFQDGGMVLLDMAVRIGQGLGHEVRIFTLDTGRLPEETHLFLDAVGRRYGVDVEIHLPRPEDVAPLVRRHGTNLFRDAVDLRLACCRVRKVLPMGRALADLDAWITGLRRDQSPSRASVPKVGPDSQHPGVIKLSPLADWSADDVADYLKTYGVPRHPLYGRGFTSIGCAPCTRPTPPGADPRAGRWWWEDEQPKECGLHWGPSSTATNQNKPSQAPGAKNDVTDDSPSRRPSQNLES